MEAPRYQDYYKIHEFLLRGVGLWPQQPRIVNFFILAIFFIFCSTSVALHVLTLVNLRNEEEMSLDNILPLLVILNTIIGVLQLSVNSAKMSELWNLMEEDWKTWAQDREVGALHEYTQAATKKSKLIAVSIGTFLAFFMTRPMLPKLVDIILHNGSQPGQYPFPIKCCHINTQKHYFLHMGYFFVATLASFFGMSCVLSSFIFHVHHACGTFTAVGRKLESIGSTEESDKRDESFGTLVTCIVRHNRAIEFTESLVSAYSKAGFCAMADTTMEVTFLGYVIIRRSQASQNVSEYIACFVTLLIILLVMYYSGQMLVDHSTSIRDYIYRGKWYRISIRSQKLLNLIAQRCNVPCKLMLGNLIVVTLEKYMQMLKTAMSYLTVLRSMQ